MHAYASLLLLMCTVLLITIILIRRLHHFHRRRNVRIRARSSTGEEFIIVFLYMHMHLLIHIPLLLSIFLSSTIGASITTTDTETIFLPIFYSGCISMQRYWSPLRYSFLRTLFLLAADYVVIHNAHTIALLLHDDCTTIARLLRNIRPPSYSPCVCHTTYNVWSWQYREKAKVHCSTFPPS